tara:strand:+ start:1095 stop:1358 length:264 start_codon:yes stop_codon:yes gene_type:complete
MEEINMSNITENAYLELANQMKEIVEEKDKELERNKKITAETKILLYKIYGLIDYVREIISNIDIGLSNINIEDILDICIEKIEKII